MPSLMSKLQAKLELWRLEQRYTRNRHRRSTFISNATYVDGEYIYQTPNSTGSSGKTTSTNASSRVAPIEEEIAEHVQSQRRRSFDNSATGGVSRDMVPDEPTPAQRKRLNRYSFYARLRQLIQPQDGLLANLGPEHC